jgi:hypothetical protein
MDRNELEKGLLGELSRTTTEGRVVGSGSEAVRGIALMGLAVIQLDRTSTELATANVKLAATNVRLTIINTVLAVVFLAVAITQTVFMVRGH